MRSVAPTLLLVLAVLARPVTATAQQPATASPIGEQTFRELVRLMNADDRTALRRFVDERFASEGPGAVPTEQRIERLSGLHSRFGELTIEPVSRSMRPGKLTPTAAKRARGNCLLTISSIASASELTNLVGSPSVSIDRC